MDNVADKILIGEGASDFGISVSTAGDVNGDGYSDVIVGADDNINRAYIYFGGSSMDIIADVTMTGEGIYNYFGNSVSSAADVNGDGYSDVIIGAWGYNSTMGRAYIYFGGSSMDNNPDVIMDGVLGSYFGKLVSKAEDVNGDGYSDVIVRGSISNNTTSIVYIFYGGASMNNVADVILANGTSGNYFGQSISSAGDINGDGLSDILISAQGNAPGCVYVYMTNQFIKINLKVLIEGMYYPVFNQMTRSDSVKVYLRNVTSPYAIIDSSKGIIDSISFSNVFVFPNALTDLII